MTRLGTTLLALTSVGWGACVGSLYATLTDICGTLVALTASLLQVIFHLANDYKDFVHGADLMDKVKVLSAVQSGLVTLIQVEKVLQWLVGAAWPHCFWGTCGCRWRFLIDTRSNLVPSVFCQP